MKNSKINGEWTIKELQNNKDWLINLDDLDKDELIIATRLAVKTDKDLYNIESTDFPLKYFLKKINHIKQQIQSGFGFVVLKNLP